MSERFRALAVDDEEIVLLSVAKTLNREGFTVDKATSVKEALARLEERSYDVIITDLMMPEINGIKFLGILKEKEIWVPTVMVTGYPTIKTAIEALHMGAVDYIPKPFTRQELIGPVRRAVHGTDGDGRDKKRDSVYGDPDLVTETPAPGDEFVLRKHSWARYLGGARLAVGIEESFLLTVGVEEVSGIALPEENDFIEQGHSSIKVLTRSGHEHGVYMPVSGRVVELNRTATEAIRRGRLGEWLIIVKSSAYQEQLRALKKRL